MYISKNELSTDDFESSGILKQLWAAIKEDSETFVRCCSMTYLWGDVIAVVVFEVIIFTGNPWPSLSEWAWKREGRKEDSAT
jgi:hypothetical protein